MQQQINKTEKQYFFSFDGLRFWWILMIVLSHFFFVFSSIYPTKAFLLNGHFAAEGFFVLSGFLQFRCNGDDYAASNPFQLGASAYLKGLKRFALLNVLTMIPFILSTSIKAVLNIKYLIIIVMNCFLVQNWFFFKDYSVNGISWFLSSILFIYLVMPLVFKIYIIVRKKAGKIRTAIVFSFVICSIIALEQWSPVYLYKVPIYNLAAFMLGATISELSDGIQTEKAWTLSLFGTLLLIVGYAYTPEKFPYLWDCVLSAAIIGVLKTSTSPIFTGKLIRITGKLSLEIMLIHYPVCCLLYPLLNQYFSASFAEALFLLFALVMVSILLAYTYSIVKKRVIRLQTDQMQRKHEI